VEIVDLGVCEGRYWAADSDRVAVVLPGAHYLPAYPLLWFCRETALARGWSVLEVWDELEDDQDPGSWVRDRLEAALRQSSSAGGVCLFAKSISTRALLLPAAARLPGVWLTPLLNEQSIAAALDARSAPTLLVGGTADASWRRDQAASFSGEVLEIAGADHALQIDGNPSASLDALREVVDRVDGFLARIAPPAGPSPE
jgi:hypothetical protein